MVNVNSSHPTYHRCLFLCLHITHPTYISNILFQSPNPTISTPRKFQHTFLQTKKGCFRTPSAFLIFYLLIPATFCCTHSPILLRKCSSILIPLIVNCFINSYALLSFSLSVRFSAFKS